jgi:hypothetical protein
MFSTACSTTEIQKRGEPFRQLKSRWSFGGVGLFRRAFAHADRKSIKVPGENNDATARQTLSGLTRYEPPALSKAMQLLCLNPANVAHKPISLFVR